MKIYSNGNKKASAKKVTASEEITYEALEKMSFEDAMSCATDYLDDVTTRDTLADYAKSCIDDENYQLAIHILRGLYDSGDSDYFLYDYSMGTLETPTEITDIEDIAHLF